MYFFLHTLLLLLTDAVNLKLSQISKCCEILAHFTIWVNRICPSLTFSQTTNFGLSQIEEFADNNSKCDEIEKYSSERAVNLVGKGKIARF